MPSPLVTVHMRGEETELSRNAPCERTEYEVEGEKSVEKVKVES